jgi:SAM-dependent methyltransferase
MQEPMTANTESPEFDHFASSYEDLLDAPLRKRFVADPLHFYYRKWMVLQRLLQRAGRKATDQRWLDVGCGKGDLLRMAGTSFASAAGCDPSAQMLGEEENFTLRQQQTLGSLPYADNSFDLVTAVCVYHHVHGVHRRLLTDEIVRVLAPGGLCCIIEHNPWNPVTRTIVKNCPVDRDADLLSARQSRRLLADSGLRMREALYFLWLPQRVFERFGAVERLCEKAPLGGQYAVIAEKDSAGSFRGASTP